MPAGRVVVVGAGYAGLAAAIRLAGDGVDVTLLERAPAPGGRAGRLDRDGYAFDTGPSVLTMPHLVDALFRRCGERLDEHVDLERLDPAYRATFHDGSTIRVRGSVEAMAEEVRAQCGAAEAARFLRLSRRLRALYEVEFPNFIDRNFDSVTDLLARPAALARLLALGGARRLQPLVAGLLSDWRLVRLFTFQALYAGLSPYQALGLYAVIAYMDTVGGVYAARGGVAAVSAALGALAARAGVEVRYGTEAEEVEVVAGRAVAVHAGGARYACDVVVLNPDLPVAYRDLLPPATVPRRVRRLRYSPSCVVVHLGLDRRLRGAAHHNIHFAREYRASFDDLLAGRPQRDPSWFLTVPTVTDPGLAPAGGEVAFWLLPVPNLRDGGIDWEHRGDGERRRAQQLLEAQGYGPVAGATVTSAVVTPLDWARRGMGAGTPFAASHHLRQTGPLRPANVAPGVRGVVFAGSGTTPGVGLPMVLVSGKLAAERATDLLRVEGRVAA